MEEGKSERDTGMRKPGNESKKTIKVYEEMYVVYTRGNCME